MGAIHIGSSLLGSIIVKMKVGFLNKHVSIDVTSERHLQDTRLLTLQGCRSDHFALYA